jgi:hypothetical protein
VVCGDWERWQRGANVKTVGACLLEGDPFPLDPLSLIAVPLSTTPNFRAQEGLPLPSGLCPPDCPGCRRSAKAPCGPAPGRICLGHPHPLANQSITQSEPPECEISRLAARFFAHGLKPTGNSRARVEEPDVGKAPVGGGKRAVETLISFTWRTIAQAKSILQFGQACSRDLREFRIRRQPYPFRFPDKAGHRNSAEIQARRCGQQD